MLSPKQLSINMGEFLYLKNKGKKVSMDLIAKEVTRYSNNKPKFYNKFPTILRDKRYKVVIEDHRENKVKESESWRL